MPDAAQKKAGRPRKSEGPRLPYEEVDRLLVEGEEVAGDDGKPTRRFPSLRELGQRFGVAHSLIAQYARQYDCQGRRQRFLAGEPVEQVVRPKSKPECLAPQAEEPLPTPDQPLPPQDEPPPPSQAERVTFQHRAEHPPLEAESATPEPQPAARQSQLPSEPESVPAPSRRPSGRPHKADAPRIPYEELDKLLVFGEVVALPDGSSTTVYPSHRELAERYGVSTSLIGNYAQSHNCKRRREEAKARIAARADQKLVELRATAIAVSKDDAVRMIDSYLLNFEKALGEGRVRFDNPTDFNTMVRLKEYVLGGADSRQEIHASLSLEDLQARHARMMREVREATAREQGLLDARPASNPAPSSEGGVHIPEARSLPEGRSVSREARSLSGARSIPTGAGEPPPRPSEDAVGELTPQAGSAGWGEEDEP